jgi:hypothetical protein
MKKRNQNSLKIVYLATKIKQKKYKCDGCQSDIRFSVQVYCKVRKFVGLNLDSERNSNR